MRVLGVFGLLLALAVPASAWAYDDPKELVTAIYAPYLGGQKHAALEPFYSDRLRSLFSDHAERLAADAEAHPVDTAEAVAEPSFDPFIDAQNALLLDLKIGEPVVIGDKAIVTVGFHNFDHPSLLTLALVREASGWKVDDVASMGAGENWMLSWLLLYDPWDVK